MRDYIVIIILIALAFTALDIFVIYKDEFSVERLIWRIAIPLFLLPLLIGARKGLSEKQPSKKGEETNKIKNKETEKETTNKQEHSAKHKSKK